jgi:hypothetical protein
MGSPERVREHPQLDLRVVRRQDEAAPGATKARRISRPSGCEWGCSGGWGCSRRAAPWPPRPGCSWCACGPSQSTSCGQRVEVGPLSLVSDRTSRIFKGSGCCVGELFEHLGVRRARGLGALLDHWQLQLIEEDGLELLRGVHVEGVGPPSRAPRPPASPPPRPPASTSPSGGRRRPARRAPPCAPAAAPAAARRLAGAP